MRVYFGNDELTEKNINKLNSKQLHEIIEMHQEHSDDKNLAKLARLACKELFGINWKGKTND